jgi:hypothetical protein
MRVNAKVERNPTEPDPLDPRSPDSTSGRPEGLHYLAFSSSKITLKFPPGPPRPPAML